MKSQWSGIDFSETSSIWVYRTASFVRKGILECGIPWLVMIAAVTVTGWHWNPQTSLGSILNQIAIHAEANPNCLDISAAL